VTDHQHPAVDRRRLNHAFGIRRGERERLLDEAVLADVQDPEGQVGVGRHRRGHDDRVELWVPEEILEIPR
jgi:hypothetical protein